jgi:uncharacterized protein (TIGR03643 family)
MNVGRFTVKYTMIKLEFYEPEPISLEKAYAEVSPNAQLNTEKTYIPSKKRASISIFDKHALNKEDYSRIVEMAWQDRTHFDVIQAQYGLSENEIKTLMRKLISAKAYRRWRKRVQGRKTKHKKRCIHKPTRFQGPW